ncbi:S8 family peptidase [Nonomuraea jiangxiensis]|uniref:Serine protease, subtilisin family n=1 Tax=Nonomuraea jiangxiensis TaxID=633440 RepID=A0A1G9KJA1_9ACTN|nr:S8 family serine peptidase [Nonomuraea jiangxiensis]SDL49483.1 Serine protease, subtilisin family [Nonomuraea jiangxiensis]
MRLRSLLACATLAMTFAALSAPPELQADTRDAGGPIISPALIAEIQERSKVRSIIQLKPGQSVAAVARDFEQTSAGSQVLEAAQSPHFFVAEVDRPLLARLRKDARVQSVYKDELSMPTLDVTTNVIRSNRANDAGWTGRGATVAILDMGIDRDHPYFAGRLVDEACFSSSDPADGAGSLCPNNQSSQIGPGSADAETQQCLINSTNACSHGTHVAGIAAGRMTTGAPSNGVAPAAGILPIQVFSRVNSALTCSVRGASTPCFLTYTSDQKLALEYVARVARNHNVAAVNLSLGGGGPYSTACDSDATAGALKPEFDALVALGVAPVVSAGNNGFQNGVAHPACISTAVTVGATNDRDELAPFTNRGPMLDLLAPGVNVNSSLPGGTYGVKSGTSMAAPHVTGLFALMKQAFPTLTVAESLRRLQTSGPGIRYDAEGRQVTTTRIDAERAMAATDPRV